MYILNLALRVRPYLRQVAVVAVSAASLCVPMTAAAQSATATNTTISDSVSPLLAGATAIGAVPVSQPVTGLVVQLQTTAAQQADLNQYLQDVMNPVSAQHRKWLTTAAFADRFSASTAQVATLTAWLQSQGLRVDYVAQGHGFVVVSGTAGQVEAALGVQLQSYVLADGETGFANAADPVVPAAIGDLIANVSGLNSFAYAPLATAKAQAAATIVSTLNAASLAAQGLNGAGVTLGLASAADVTAAQAIAPQAGVSDAALAEAEPLLAAAIGIDGNAAAAMRVGGGCAANLTQSEMAWFEQVAMQANAQGITLLASTLDCASGAAYPAILSEVTAVGKLVATVSAPAYTVARPAWQNAAGLLADGLRQTPDISVAAPAGAGDAAAFAGALALVAQKAGTRQGNVNGILYTLAQEPGVFSQTTGTGLVAMDSSRAVSLLSPTDTTNYDALSGLGTPDITALLTLWPMGSTTSYTSINSVSSYTPTHGSGFTVTAAVSPSTATGVVEFYANGTTFLGQATLTGGIATLASNATLAGLAGGQYAITASYMGDGTYGASTTTSPATVSVQPESATITATPAGTPTIGTSFTVAINVAGASGVGTPTGTVKVTIPGVSDDTISTVPTGNGNWTATVTIGQAGGPFTLLTSYSGDPSFAATTAYPSVTIAEGATSTAVSYTPNPPTPGSPITVTAVVTPGVSGSIVATPTGTVTFYDGSTSIGSSALSSGSASASVTLSPGKTHSLTAKYAGDNNFTASTSTAVTAVGGVLASTVGLTSSTYAATYGQPVTLTATVGPAAGITTNLTPTGTVQFYAGTTLLGTSTLSAGSAAYTTSALPVGLQSITATYLGDTNFAAANSTVYNGVTVSPAVGTLTATISPAVKVPYGATATITATLVLSNGGTPSGTITATVPGTVAQGGGVYDGALTANVGGSATANIVVNVPPPGNYTITVACAAATTNYSCSPIAVTVSTVKGNTSTAVSVLPLTPMAGQPTQLTAVVSNVGGGTGNYTYTGTISFYDNGVAIASGAVTANQAEANATFKAGTLHNITAIYSGDTIWVGSTSPATLVTALANPTTTTLSTNLTTALVGTNEIMTATVGGTNSTQQLIPTGFVTFYDNFGGVILTLGTEPLAADGPYAALAQLTTTGLQGGTHNIYSIYSGDSDFASSTSGTMVVTEQDYSLVFSPASMTLNRGQSGQATVTLGAVGGFSGTITFGCTPPPDTQTTCSFQPAVVPSGGSTTLYIGTTASNAIKGSGQMASVLAPIILLPMTAAGLLLLWPCGRSRLRAGLLVLVLAVVATIANTGCAHVDVGGTGSTTGTGSGSGTPAGSMNFTITTAGTSVSSSGTYTVRKSASYLVTTQ